MQVKKFFSIRCSTWPGACNRSEPSPVRLLAFFYADPSGDQPFFFEEDCFRYGKPAGFSNAPRVLTFGLVASPLDRSRGPAKHERSYYLARVPDA